MPTRSTFLLALVVGLILPTLAAAQAQNASLNVEARALFEKGNADYARAQTYRGDRKIGFLQNALRSYTASQAITRSKNAVYNTAVTLSELQRWDEAYEHLSEYLKHKITNAERSQAQRRLQDLTSKVAIVQVESIPPGASVHIDRQDFLSRGKTPLRTTVLPGEHTLWLQLDGYEHKELSISVKAGVVSPAISTLKAIPVGVKVESGTKGVLKVDGKVVEAGQQLKIEPGIHLFELRTENGTAQIRKEILAGQKNVVVKLRLPASLSKRKRDTERKKRWAIGLFSAAGATGIAAIVLSFKAKSLANDYKKAADAFEQDPTQAALLSRAQNLADRTERMNIGADVAWAGALGLAIGGTVAAIRHKRSKKKRSKVQLSVSPSARGVYVGLRINGAGL